MESAGLVSADAPHTIQLQRGLDPLYLTEVISHEVYHLFYSVRHLITVDEEEQATIFGQLVKHIHEIYKQDMTKDICMLPVQENSTSLLKFPR